MFEDIQKHRQAVRENIEKSLQIGYTESEDFEKAHKVGDVHPNGKWVWTQLPSGKFDWRVIKVKPQANKRLLEENEKKDSSEYEGEEGFNKLCNQIRLKEKAVYCQFTGDLENPEPSKETGSTDKGIVNRVRLLKFRPNEEKGLFKKVEVTVQYQGGMSTESVTLSVPKAEKLVASISKVDDLPKKKEPSKNDQVDRVGDSYQDAKDKGNGNPGKEDYSRKKAAANDNKED